MRALVTRPGEDAAPLAAALRAHGIAPVIEPLLTIRPSGDGARQVAQALPGVQALLFTSANGVRAFAAASERRDLPAYAVGEATAAAARIADFRHVASAGGDVDDLARLVEARLKPAHGALLHAAGSAVAGDLAGRLGSAGFTLRRVVLYSAEPAQALGEATAKALADAGLDLALFFSPRTAATFVRLAQAAGLVPACRGITALALSPAVAAALGGVAWRAIRVADTPTQAALLALLDGMAAHPDVCGEQDDRAAPRG